MGFNGKWRRPKRKQGVTCDSCKLRRLRCDKLERSKGMRCSRCEDKSIICTNEHIQSKRKKSDSDKTAKDDVVAKEDEGIIGSAPLMSRDVSTIANEQHQKASSRAQKSRIEEGLWLPGGYRFLERLDNHSFKLYFKSRLIWWRSIAFRKSLASREFKFSCFLPC